MQKYCPDCRTIYWAKSKYCDVHGEVLKPFLLDDRFQIVERLGEGGYGDVYRGLQTRLGAEYAIKILKPPEIFDETKEVRHERFLREGRSTFRVRNPHVVQIHDAAFCRFTDLFFLVMELVKGITLKDFLASHPHGLELAIAHRIFKQLCDGAAAIHEQGIVHRDLKPENLMLVEGNFNNVKIIDFGIAKDLLRQSHSLTRPGTMVGTDFYMAPEQFTPGREQDAGVDVFSLGLVLFEMLTGRLPDVRNSRIQRDLELQRMLFPIEMAELRRLARPSISDATLEVIHKALQNKRESRHPGVREFLDEFEATLESGQPVPKVIRELSVGTLAITTAQAGTELFLDGKSIGVSKTEGEIFRLEGLPAWTLAEITGRLLGHEPITKRIQIDANQEIAVGIEFPIINAWTNSVGLEFVLIPKGNFIMGSEKEDEDRWNSILSKFGLKTDMARERPSRLVRISRSFFFGKYLVTQQQWRYAAQKLPRVKRDLVSSPSVFKGELLPVETVSWDDCEEFIARLNALYDGYEYRFPTEAEWEYACRAGTTGDYADDLDTMGWYANNSGNSPIDPLLGWINSGHDWETYRSSVLEPNECQTHPVGLKASNAFGLYDMHGNVWEWCADWFHPDYYKSRQVNDPKGPPSGHYRVLRGGAWFAGANNCRSALRYRYSPTERKNFTGLRVVAHPLSS